MHRNIALQTIRAFQELWGAEFPINRMDTAEKFASPTDFRPDGSFIETHGPDLVNDTSAFFCRPTTGSSSGWSQHSYGTAIDINPVQNPYIKGATVIPENGTTARNASVPGTIVKGSLPVAAMKRAGLVWGGTWSSLKDYMHFSDRPLTPTHEWCAFGASRSHPTRRRPEAATHPFGPATASD